MSQKTIEIQFIPKVRIAGIPLQDLSSGEQFFTSIDNIFKEGEILTADIKVGTNWEQGLIDELRNSILDRLEYAQIRGFDYLTDDEDSPPLINMIDDTEKFLRENYNEFGGITAEYFIVKEGNTGAVGDPIYTPLNRIFLSAPPTIRYDTCEYFTPDTDDLLTFDYNGKKLEASCGFQYFYQTWKKDPHFSTYVCNGKKRRSKIKKEAGGGYADSDFEKIRHYCDTKPPQYDDWYFLYKDFMAKKNLDNAIIKPIESSLADKLVETIPEFKLLDFTPPKYTDLQTYNSMSVDDIVRLCMWMGLSLNIYDVEGDLMLCYDARNIYHSHTNKKTTGSRVVVKVVDNHGYFVKRGTTEVVSCATGGNHGWGGFYPADGEIGAYEGRKEEKIIDEIAGDSVVIVKHPKARFHQGELKYKWDGGWANATDLLAYDEYQDIRRQQEAPYCKMSPPLTPDELIAMMKSGAIYYVGKRKLNGIVNYLQRNKCLTSSIEFVDNIQKAARDKEGNKKEGRRIGARGWKIIKPEVNTGVKPNNLRGTPTTIHKATYGKLKLYAYHQHPKIKFTMPNDYDGILAVDDDLAKECIDGWKENFPVLKKYAIPTPTSMGKAIFDSLNLDCYSSMNSAIKDIFFTGETKPDFRRYPETHDNACAFSLDFSKAYSNAAKFMDCEWSVLDAIDAPQRFLKNTTFDPSAFYLVRELETGFPYKDLKGKGMVLYHGCLLRHLVGKVKIEYIINSHKKLPKDYFVEFVNKCIEIAGDGSNNIVSAKQLVNNTFGNLKNKGGIRDYKLFINSDKIELSKSFAKGQPVYDLDSSCRWRNSSFITARGYYEHHFLTGQPIRLQIMERINELNFLLDTAVRKSLNRDINLILVKTDALYYQYPNGEQYPKKEYNFNPHKDIDIEDINSRLPEGYEVKIEKPGSSGLNPIEVGINWTLAPDKLNQLPITTYWKKDYKNTEILDREWDKTEIKDIFNKYWNLGGLYCNGEGGVGKTEIIKGIDEICRKNRIKLRWLRGTYKIVDRDNWVKRIDEWKKDNPCMMWKLAPTNKACNNIGGRTLHKSLGLRIMKNIDDDDAADSDDEDSDDGSRANYIINSMLKNPPEVISVDEISMISGEGWSILSYIKQRNPDIRFFCFGDIARQLPPVGEEHRMFDNSICLRELCNFNKLILLYNFRRGCAGNNTLWERAANKPETFEITSDTPITYRNLSYTNKTRKEVIDLVQNSHPNPQLWLDCGCKEDPDYTGQNEKLMLAIGTPLIARKSIDNKTGCGIAKNEIWSVKTITDEEVVLEYKDRNWKFSHDEIKNLWLSAYCITIHKSQGDTYRDKYTIWDWGKISKRKDRLSKKLRYTAVSRSVNPDELIYFKP